METKFEDLPEAVQVIAAHTLKEALTRIDGGLKSEPAKELARSINAAFVELFSSLPNADDNALSTKSECLVTSHNF